tara:strand:+ start:189 stop:527 length:339 start_codon:yes stop_codon:yes gene_type:complete
MKPLLPSLREKKRYLVYEVVSKDNVSKLEVEKSIIGSCLQFLGELNLGKAGVISVGEVYKNNKGVLKVATRYVDEIKMSLGLIKEINGKKAIVNTIGVTSTLKKASTKYLGV